MNFANFLGIVKTQVLYHLFHRFMSLVGGKRRHGIYRRWISVMVPMDVTHLDAGRLAHAQLLFLLIGTFLLVNLCRRRTREN